MYAGISSRQVRKCLEVLNLVFESTVMDLPSHQTVLDWVKKCGLSAYDNCRKRPSLKEAEYSIIMDNSITIGGEDLHVELAAPAIHPGHALKHSDVELWKMSVDKKWTRKRVQAELADTIVQAGRKPEFVLTDNGSIMLNAAEGMGVPCHRDISHSFGMCLEQVYGKDKEYAELVQKIGYARKYGHTPVAHLMPPKRRAYARFMNVFDSIQWAHEILQSDVKMPQLAREVFGFVNTHASIIEEMQDVMEAFRFMEQLCKEKGLSDVTVRECVKCINRTLLLGGDRPRMLGELLIGYFRREGSLLKGKDSVHNISSDVIESSFGYLKSRMSSCANHGFTSLILVMPLHFKLADLEGCAKFDIRGHLTETSLTKLAKWKVESLMPNLAIRRSMMLKIAS